MQVRLCVCLLVCAGMCLPMVRLPMYLCEYLACRRLRVRATNYIYVCMCACIYIYIYKFVDTLHMHILLHNMSFYSHM